MIYSISIKRKVSIGICNYFYSLEKYNVYLMIFIYYYFYIFEIVQGYLYLIFHIFILFYINLFYIF